MEKSDFRAIVNQAIETGIQGVSLKRTIEGVIQNFMEEVDCALSAKIKKEITHVKEASRVLDDGSSSLFGSLAPGKIIEFAYDIFIVAKGDTKMPRKKFKLFSYEYNPTRTLPLVLRYNDATVVCPDEGKLANGLGGMLTTRAVSLIEWCQNNI